MREINLIVACNNQGVIGTQKNELPWLIKRDLAHFRKHTMGDVLVVGRKTFESLGERALGGRRMAVITRRHQNPRVKNVKFFKTVNELLDYKPWAKDKLWVAGGGTIYRLMLPLVENAYITKIDVDVPLYGATFPIQSIESSTEWDCVYSSSELEEDGIKFQFFEYSKNKN